jgi:transposase
VKARREIWFEEQLDLEPSRLVFLDECGTNAKMARLYGRSRRGERCRAAVPHGHWKTTTLVAALTLNGIVAPMVIDGAMNGERFKAYVEQALAPVLKAGDTVIWDNLPAHRISGIAEIVERTGASLMRLPPYSPDFNPIEKAFAQIKSHLKKVAARTKETLDQAIATAIDLVKPQHARNYFRSCGYQDDTV